MRRITLTDLVDIISKSGTHKAKKVKSILERDDYHPAFDFYKKVRDSIVAYHKGSITKKDFIKVPTHLADLKKEVAYENIVKQYISFLGRKEIEWFVPPTFLYEKDKIAISINPELGLIINGKKHLIKLHFKSEALVKHKIDVITHLMEISLKSKVPAKTIMSVLDIQNRKLISPTVPIDGMTAMVDAELAYIMTIMESLKIK